MSDSSQDSSHEQLANEAIAAWLEAAERETPSHSNSPINYN